MAKPKATKHSLKSSVKHEPTICSRSRIKKKSGLTVDTKSKSKLESDHHADGDITNNSTSVSNNLSREIQRVNKSIAKERLQRTIFIGNLPPSVSKKRLIRLINEVLLKDQEAVAENCRVESLRFRGAIPVTGGTGKFALKRAAIHQEFAGVSQTRIAYVVLTSSAGIPAALSLNGRWVSDTNIPAGDINNTNKPLNPEPIASETDNNNTTGRHIRVDRAVVNLPKNCTDNCVFLGNLPFDVSDEEIYSALSSFGAINHVRLVRDRNTGAVKGFGFAYFNDSASASLAIRGSATVEVKGRPIRIQQWENTTDTQVRSMKISKPMSHSGSLSSSEFDSSVSKVRLKKWHKLDQTGKAKGITLPSNLTGLQRIKFLEKRIQKKMKRKLRREQQRESDKVSENQTKKVKNKKTKKN